MGDLYSASCPCGYLSENHAVGAGMSGPDELELYYCRNCNEYCSIKSTVKEKRCRECRSRKITPIHIQDGGLNLCPACKQNTLQFVESGCWD